ncbi:hypothetical protein RJ639_036308 [Escallonia herrerae]|uniref:tRNA (adenine(58)-N(1))-methyltransferase n=1 Tax=Escallonia herrerae TaxID=1293975 RepID=A0AA88WS55_9ASTE|nr:hypothetical protein RJ639_036308 [Escallonia herrerae]
MGYFVIIMFDLMELLLLAQHSIRSILMMLPIDPSKKLSFRRCISDGDLVIVYERHDTMKAVKVSESSTLQNRFGVFKHSDWIGKPFGSKVFSSKGGFVYLLAPTPELWTLVLSHRTQILYIADISFVVMYLEIVPGCLVLESGTGSGSLTTSLARAVAPTGHVYTFDFHEQRAASAREDFDRTGLSSLVTVGVRDIQGEGFPEDFIGVVDSVFLDLPQPWLAIPSADIRTFEVLLRTYEVREGKMESCQGDEGRSFGSLPCKRRQTSNEGSNWQENLSSPMIIARPSVEARGHGWNESRQIGRKLGLTVTDCTRKYSAANILHCLVSMAAGSVYKLRLARLP